METMRLSKLIEQLQEILDAHGDMPVQTARGYDASAEEVQAEDVGIITNPKLSFDQVSEKVLDIG